MIKFLVLGCCVYILILLLAYLFQDKLMFFPHKFDRDFDYNLSVNASELFLKTGDNETINCIYATRAENKNVVLYFHGNATSLNSWKEVADAILPKGANLLMIDYRGYGKSTGTISEKGFYEDAETAYQFLVANGYKNENIFFYGRSLGSGVAVNLAVQHQVKGLILESPYTSVLDVAKSHRPYLLPDLILKYNFNSLQKAAKVKMPVLIFHGTIDQTIPVAQGKKLAAAMAGKTQLVIIENGNHSNLSTFDDYENALTEFLSK